MGRIWRLRFIILKELVLLLMMILYLERGKPNPNPVILSLFHEC